MARIAGIDLPKTKRRNWPDLHLRDCFIYFQKDSGSSRGWWKQEGKGLDRRRDQRYSYYINNELKVEGALRSRLSVIDQAIDGYRMLSRHQTS